MASRPERDEIPEADRFESAPHPREASNLIGHAQAEADLLRALAAGELPHALLIGGGVGIGKATFAWRLARFLLVHEDPAAAAGAGTLATDPSLPAVRQALALAHPDLFLLRREWVEKTRRLASEIRVGDVRRVIHMFQQSPAGRGYRVAIIDSAEDLNPSGANALLKLIEEPPPRSAIIIVSHRPGRVLATIRSRCRKINLAPLAPDDMGAVVASLGSPWSETPDARRSAAIERSGGSLHAALRFIEGRGAELDARLARLFAGLPEVDWRGAHALAELVALKDHESDYDALLAAMFNWLGARVRAGARTDFPGAARMLAPYAQVWEKVAEAAQQTDALNLDKRPFVLALFADLAAAAKASAAERG